MWAEHSVAWLREPFGREVRARSSYSHHHSVNRRGVPRAGQMGLWHVSNALMRTSVLGLCTSYCSTVTSGQPHVGQARPPFSDRGVSDTWPPCRTSEFEAATKRMERMDGRTCTPYLAAVIKH